MKGEGTQHIRKRHGFKNSHPIRGVAEKLMLGGVFLICFALPFLIYGLIENNLIVYLMFRIYVYPFIFLGLGAWWVFGVWAKNKRDIFYSIITPFVLLICLMVAWEGLEKVDSFTKDLISGDREKKEGVEVISNEILRDRSAYRYLRLSDDPSQQYWAIGLPSVRTQGLVGERVSVTVLPHSKGILSLESVSDWVIRQEPEGRENPEGLTP